MLIFLKLVASKTIVAECEPYTLIDELKLYVQDNCGIDINSQTLIFNGNKMENERMLEDYGIIKQNSMVLVLEENDGDSLLCDDEVRFRVKEHNEWKQGEKKFEEKRRRFELKWKEFKERNRIFDEREKKIDKKKLLIKEKEKLLKEKLKSIVASGDKDNENN